MRNLLLEPAWQESDLGIPLPDHLHAVSVCLPTWKSVVEYEEGRDRVLRKMRVGYPRFFRHPSVERLFEVAQREVASEGERSVVFPTRVSAQRAQRFVERRCEVAARIASFHGLQALVVPEKAYAVALEYWRFSGEVVSSRQAIDYLDGQPVTSGRFKILRSRVARLTSVAPEQVFLFSSGMAACTAVLRSLPGLRTGKKTLQIEFPYVDSLKIQELFGNGVVFLAEGVGESLDEALRRVRQGEFAAVMTEVPSNPLMRTVDLEKVASACRDGATPFVVDVSVAIPGSINALRYADVITSSLTKWYSTKGDVMAGMACIREDSMFHADFAVALAGEVAECAPMYPGDSLALLNNIKEGGELRAKAHQNAQALVHMLLAHPAVDQVWHPSVTCRNEYDKIRSPHGGYGGLFSFTLKAPKKVAKFYDALALCKGPSFGTPFTLVCPYVLLAHYREQDWAEGCGVPPHLIRVSAGCEDQELLLQKFTDALAEL